MSNKITEKYFDESDFINYKREKEILVIKK